MPERQLGEITLLLRQWRDGSVEAENELFELINADLRRIAHYLMRGERKGHSLQATELVDQIYIRLSGGAKRVDWQDRQHFFAVAGRAMRRHLIDLARGRSPKDTLPLEDLQTFLRAGSMRLDSIIAIDRLLGELERFKPAWSHLVELKYFLGLTDEEAAEVLGVKPRTLQRMWKDARQWLYERMEPGP